ncbi:GCG_CRPN prefix-to-repeats domain-containing protein [Sphingomonas sp. PAMC 26621]|uniref:GCG_CRPN prefix-to-repeats domain-containing protein n=1 Tax=Sphingomonas sp. PAMC 26621 TaxID=1112213 RepID=UPI0009D91F29
MRKILLAAIAAGAAFTVVAPAEARQGCGVGAHRGPGGYCRPNRGRVVVAPRLRIGGFYGGRGYWDGRRYCDHRYRYHGGWRYR